MDEKSPDRIWTSRVLPSIWYSEPSEATRLNTFGEIDAYLLSTPEREAAGEMRRALEAVRKVRLVLNDEERVDASSAKLYARAAIAAAIGETDGVA